MKRISLTVLATSLLAIGVLIIMRMQSRDRAAGEAGVAYVENEDGTLTRASEVRPEKRTIVPVRKPKGSEAEWLTDFELIERSGKLINSQSFRGQPYVVGFFFATCPSICVPQNEKFKLLQDKFHGQPIRLVEITCDPEVDRPEVLAAYAERFKADPEQWLFFTGEMEYIQRVGSEMFNIGIMRRGHPERFALVGADGKVFGYYTWSDAGQWQALQRDMAKLIAELPK